jgi:hypothetical protein
LNEGGVEGQQKENRGIARVGSASIACVELFGVVGRSVCLLGIGCYKHFGPTDLRRSQCILESRWSVSGACLGEVNVTWWAQKQIEDSGACSASGTGVELFGVMG